MDGLTGKKILWLEDDKFLSNLIAQKLSKGGGQLIYCKNGDEAIKAASEQKPDVILLDILLPGMDGIEVLSKLKENPETKNIPVIMFSNVDDKSKVDQSINLGAKGFFVKATMDLDQIIQEILKVL